MPPSPILPGYEFGACNRGGRSPSHEIGFVRISESSLALWVIQMSDADLRSQLAIEIGPAICCRVPAAELNSLNDLLCQATKGGPHDAAVCVMVIDRSNHSIAVTGAGFEGPEIRTPDNEIILPDRDTGVPLGMIPSFKYETKVIALAPRASAIWISPYTSQIMNLSEQMYGGRGLPRQVQAAPPEPKFMIDYIVKDIAAFIGNCEQTDDICILCIRRID